MANKNRKNRKTPAAQPPPVAVESAAPAEAAEQAPAAAMTKIVVELPAGGCTCNFCVASFLAHAPAGHTHHSEHHSVRAVTAMAPSQAQPAPAAPPRSPQTMYGAPAMSPYGRMWQGGMPMYPPAYHPAYPPAMYPPAYAAYASYAAMYPPYTQAAYSQRPASEPGTPSTRDLMAANPWLVRCLTPINAELGDSSLPPPQVADSSADSGELAITIPRADEANSSDTSSQCESSHSHGLPLVEAPAPIVMSPVGMSTLPLATPAEVAEAVEAAAAEKRAADEAIVSEMAAAVRGGRVSPTAPLLPLTGDEPASASASLVRRVVAENLDKERIRKNRKSLFDDLCTLCQQGENVVFDHNGRRPARVICPGCQFFVSKMVRPCACGRRRYVFPAGRVSPYCSDCKNV